MRRFAVLFGCAVALAPTAALADAPAVFGTSPRAAALAGSDVAAAAPFDAPRENAAFAAKSGLSVRLGYGYAASELAIDGRKPGLDDVSGTSIGSHYGMDLAKDVSAGGAFTIYLPDRYLAKLAFRPATEPQWVLYEAPLEHVSIDAVGAIRYKMLAVGGGVALGFDVGGSGTAFKLAQDARGTYADANLDVSLPLRAAPIVGVSADLGIVGLGATFRGEIATNVAIDSFDTITINGNPLNGTATVKVRGDAAFDPAHVDAGARFDMPFGLTLMTALDFAAYADEPPPVADVTLDVKLGATPGQREGRFVSPRFRDTLSPRVGLEAHLPAGDEWRVVAQLGYAFVPSPVPAQTGWTSYADSNRHTLGVGAGVRLGRLFGVAWQVDLAGQLHLFETRVEDKPDASLPHANFVASGDLVAGSIALEGTWR